VLRLELVRDAGPEELARASCDVQTSAGSRPACSGTPSKLQQSLLYCSQPHPRLPADVQGLEGAIASFVRDPMRRVCCEANSYPDSHSYPHLCQPATSPST
jgi:hypothetical protein